MKAEMARLTAAGNALALPAAAGIRYRRWLGTRGEK
jgi:hypothetical protein